MLHLVQTFLKRHRRRLLLLLAAVLLTAAIISIHGTLSRVRAQQAQAAASGSGLIASPVSAYREITYCNGTATLSFALDESGAWYWTDDPDFPLDQSYPLRMVDTLAAIKPQQTITEAEPLETYGLDEPSRTLTAIAGNGLTFSLALGKTTTDGDSYYMLMNGASKPVYIISDELAQEMAVGIYEMCVLPEIAPLPEEQIASVTISGAADVTLTAIHGEAAEGETPITTWRSSGANVTDDPQVQKILSQVLAPGLDGCVDYRPSDGAVSLCGFDEPDAVITVRYASGGAVETRTLTVGARELNEQGRYVRIDDDPTIYRMNTDRLDAVMPAAAEGLGGSAAAE